MKGTAMAFEYVIKIIILVAVAAIVISIILLFYDDIRLQVSNLFGKEKQSIETEDIKAQSFSASQVRAYIKSCWSKTGDRYEKDVVCYILKGDVSLVNPWDLQNVEGVNAVDVTNFDNTKSTTIIKFIDLGNKITVES